jgi:hypothetical protein
MPKVLVCGDVGGNLTELYKRVATINAKNGPFDCLFCVGEVRTSSQDALYASETDTMLHGCNKTFPCYLQFFASAELGGEEEGDQQPNFVDQDPLKEYGTDVLCDTRICPAARSYLFFGHCC